MILSQGDCVYVPVSYDPDWLIPLPPTVDQIEQGLAATRPEAILVTHPTYYGTVSDLEALTRLCKKHGVLVFADEAHGGHFLFSSELPATALQCGADAVVQSTHKTLGSLTQTSMLHAKNASWYAKTVQAQRVLQTTSPSHLFFAVLDEVRRVLATQGSSLVERALGLAQTCVQQLSQIDGVELLPRTYRVIPPRS